MMFHIDGQKKVYDIDKIEKLKELKTSKDVYKIEVKSMGYFREIEIRSEKLDRMKKKDMKGGNMLKSLLLKKIRRSEMKVDVKMKGLGFSFVDSEPKEILYISIYKIEIDFLQ